MTKRSCFSVLCVFMLYAVGSSSYARPRGNRQVRSRSHGSVRQANVHRGTHTAAVPRSTAPRRTVAEPTAARRDARDRADAVRNTGVTVHPPARNDDIVDTRKDYRKDIHGSRNDLRDDLRAADDRSDVVDARKDYREDVHDARHDVRHDVHDEVHGHHDVVVHRHVTHLPAGYSTIYVYGTPYYYHNSVYYVQADDGYMVVDIPSEDDVIDELPDGYKEVKIDGRMYFTNGTLYYTQVYQNNAVAYLKVNKP